MLPRIRQLARREFVQRGHKRWFIWKLYQDLCAAVGHVHTGMNPMFLISQDSDPRHSMIDLGGHSCVGTLRTGHLPDRRSLKHGEKGYIPVDPIKNYVPTAPKVPDSLKVPIESFFGPVKRTFKKLQHGRKHNSPSLMVKDIRAAIEKAATPEHIKHCFERGELCMQVFAGKQDEVVHAKGRVYHCTHGKWLPRDLCA